MVTIMVQVRVKPEFVDAFVEETKKNAQNSLLEPGVLRFDILRHALDPAAFLLVEVYRTEQDPARHKETPHYKAWRSAVEHMMAEPRSSTQYIKVFPPEEDH